MGRVKSKLDGEPEQPPPQPPRPGEYGYNQRSSRYDSDPRVLGDDFSHLNLQDQSRGDSSRRPLANPNLFTSARYSNSEPEGTPPVMIETTNLFVVSIGFAAMKTFKYHVRARLHQVHIPRSPTQHHHLFMQLHFLTQQQLLCSFTCTRRVFIVVNQPDRFNAKRGNMPEV